MFGNMLIRFKKNLINLETVVFIKALNLVLGGSFAP